MLNGKTIAATLAIAFLFAEGAAAREQVQIAGSSTVLPYATIVAEAFGENFDFPTPVVQGGGSGAGRKKLCEGVGEHTIDIANSSSRIKQSDIDLCASNGVDDVMEVRIGYDGIVFASEIDSETYAFTPADWYNALAARVLVNGELVANPHRTWADVSPELPDVQILAFIPGTKHGTREVFDVKVLEAGCEESGALEALGDDKECLKLRTDGRSVDIDGDYTETLARLQANSHAIGVFGLSFYENNTDKLRVATMSGVEPTVETIANGEYPVSRPLYFYVKIAHLDVIPGMQEYIEFFLSDEIAGPDGPLAEYGLVSDPELTATQEMVARRTPLGGDGQVAERAQGPGRVATPAPKSSFSTGYLVVIVALLAALGYVFGRKRALASAGGDILKLHSLPSYYGLNVALTVITPAFALLALWLLVQPVWIERSVAAKIPDSAIPEGSTRSLLMSDVRRVSEGMELLGRPFVRSAPETPAPDAGARLREDLGAIGIVIGNEISPEVMAAAEAYRGKAFTGRLAMTVAVLLTALGGFVVSMAMTNKDFRARNTVERGILFVLLGAASIAILTTAGIIFSLFSETLHFFRLYPWQDFLFNLTWNPQFRGGSDLGIVPLFWGTLFVSFFALLFAVPVGLFAAIYLSEYATSRVRKVAKPLIEVLAGIPTIVYGLFALITVGPMLRDYFAAPLGLGDSSSSVMTAGLVMGIMLIPFVSSLSDDIINAVPQSMRDGSYGLGATQSETIRQVILPAALPGIVGAILLAASRAIGETMIVVMGAGAAAKLSMNPFEAMTTITVKIVSQLTGDTEFASPETLVAFALGLSLFVVTLGLNILALWIVRRYREQYE